MRWALLADKRYWLSPVIGQEDADGVVMVNGERSIRLRSVPAVRGPELPTQVAAFETKYGHHPVFVAELCNIGEGRWSEISRGFILPKRWSMTTRLDEGAEGASGIIEETASITRMQLALERMLRSGGGLEQWSAKLDQLAAMAGRTERRGQDIRERLLAEIWLPPEPKVPLDLIDGFAPALVNRWSLALSDPVHMCELRQAVLSYLAAAHSPTEAVIDALAGLRICPTQRVLGHFVLDNLQRLGQRRAQAIVDRPLLEPSQVLWDDLSMEAMAIEGTVCPKVLAKACRLLNLPPPLVPRAEALRTLSARFAAFGFPDDVVAVTHREAVLTGAVQLCGMQLRVAQGEMLQEVHIRPLLPWLVDAGDLSVSQALVHSDVCGWDGAAAELKRHLREAGQIKRARRLGQPVPAVAVSAPESYDEVEMMAGVDVVFVDSDAAVVEVDMFERIAAEGGFVALDAEWKPYARDERHTQVELVQLAVPSRCWILDMPRLVRHNASAVASLLRRLGEECIFVGYGLEHDLQRISESFDEVPRFLVAKALDLETSGSLQGLVQGTLGKRLNKSQQCSAWSRRPLSVEQVTYAALDAHVLLQLAAGDPAAQSPRALADVLAGGCWDRAQQILAPLGPRDVERAIETLGLAAGGESAGQLATPCKTLALVGKGGYRAVALLQEDSQLSLPRAAAALAVDARSLRLARREELPRLFGYRAGGLGPLGLRAPACPTVLDAALAESALLRVGAGESNKNVVLGRHALVEAVGGLLAPIASG